MFYLTQRGNIEEIKEVLRKLLGLSLPNRLIQNIPLSGHRDSVKKDAELAERDGNIMA